jgi:hypothetical protein
VLPHRISIRYLSSYSNSSYNLPWMKVPGFGTETEGVSPHLVSSQTPEEARLSSARSGSGIDLDLEELGGALFHEHIHSRSILDVSGRPVTTSKISHPDGVLPMG